MSSNADFPTKAEFEASRDDQLELMERMGRTHKYIYVTNEAEKKAIVAFILAHQQLGRMIGLGIPAGSVGDTLQQGLPEGVNSTPSIENLQKIFREKSRRKIGHFDGTVVEESEEASDWF